MLCHQKENQIDVWCKHFFFKAGFSISSFEDVQYLKKFLHTIYDHWRLYHPSNQDTTETYSDTSDNADE